MQKPRLRTSTPLLLLGISIYLSGCPNLIAQATEFQGQTENGAYYKIALPENWQPHDGLVIWNHGYQGYTKTELEPDPSLGPLADIALSQGYAMAASSYSQTGWAVFNSHIDNQQLYRKFVELAGDPGGIFIQGASLGGIVSMRDLEEGLIPGIDGAFLMCGGLPAQLTGIRLSTCVWSTKRFARRLTARNYLQIPGVNNLTPSVAKPNS